MSSAVQIIINEINNLIGNRDIKEIINLEKDNIYNKSAVPVIIKNYINNNSSYNLDVLKDYNIVVKFISVDLKYNCFEPMSFSSTSLYNILFENWDSPDVLERASLRNQLNYSYLLVPIVKIKTRGVYNNFYDWKIGDFTFWEPNSVELNMIGEEWGQAKEIIQKGVILKKVVYGKSFRNTNNLLKQSETNFIHLRPHAKNSFDYDLPYSKFTNGAVEITKQSFWLNKKFINQLLQKYKWKTILKEE